MNLKENFSRSCLENSVESNKNKTQVTFVCNNDTGNEDKQFDLHYYMLQGNKALNNRNVDGKVDSPTIKNINLPLSTENYQYFSSAKSIKSFGIDIKDKKNVTPKFFKDTYENNSSLKKQNFNNNTKSTTTNKNSNNINFENNSFSTKTSKMNNNNTNLPFNIYLPMQSLVNNFGTVFNKNNNHNINYNTNMINKDDSITLNSLNMNNGSNSVLINSPSTKLYNNKNDLSIKSQNYIKEIADSFKEKVLFFKSNLNSFKDNNYISKNYSDNNFKKNYFFNNNNCNNNIYSTKYFENSVGKLNSTINYIETPNINNVSLNSLNQNESKNYLKYRRNKNNSMNYVNNNNFMQSFYCSPRNNRKNIKNKSIPKTNFPIVQNIVKKFDERLSTYEYNFPFNQKIFYCKNSEENIKNLKYEENNIGAKTKNICIELSNEIIKEEISSPTHNTEINITNSNNRIVVYSSKNSENKNIIYEKKDIITGSKINCENDKKIKNLTSLIFSHKNENNNYKNMNNNIVYRTKSNYENEKNLNLANNDIGNNNLRNLNYDELKKFNIKNNLLLFIGVLSNIINKNKINVLKKLTSFTQDEKRSNRRYAVKMLYRLIKKKLVFLKLKFLTRSKYIFFKYNI